MLSTRLLCVMLAVSACATTNKPTRIKYFVKHGVSRGEARSDYRDCNPNRYHIEMNPLASPVTTCMIERGYEFKPFWYRIPDSDPTDLEEAESGCRQGRDVGHDYVSGRLFVQCMNEHGWNYNPPF